MANKTVTEFMAEQVAMDHEAVPSLRVWFFGGEWKASCTLDDDDTDRTRWDVATPHGPDEALRLLAKKMNGAHSRAAGKQRREGVGS
jgi:hypothetical protein